MGPNDVARAPRLLRTERLDLQAPRPEHAGVFLDSLNASLPALGYVGWGQRPRDLAWSERFCAGGAELFDSGECVVYYAFHRSSGAYVARIDLHTFDFEAPRAEIGYVGDLRHAGRGLVREAALAVVQLGFAIGLARVHALSDLRNQRALQFAHNLGMHREGLLRAYERDPQGRLADMVMFAAYNPQPV